ncbi:efflux RND transporter periplasmic adaptor subunit [Aliiglaciecola sp. CAU 1673]|uniref:efflux RND transporter periplasmic adaptor subunit n=1 Tax=Aliiglaciecola sp. CAU 1673 TaxID=3032595 RepID=UPI0023DC798B|nr:efflux RND transporter periplasmic adaptor subunit [Aliiglaciecola sp. CAU 1673]MDF2178337.1 efflux RND transporter periplasmic adaptor subunit [Aliiglaciecola sp. CAU 1673]
MRHQTFGVFSTGSLLGLVLTLSGCSEPEAPEVQVQPRLVNTYTISRQSVQDWLEFPGVVEAAQSADLGFRVTGKLATLEVNEGDTVTTGQVLATLDDTDYQIQLSSRQAEFDQTNADFNRAQNLLSQNLIARADYDKLEAQRAASLAALTAAKQNVQYTKLTAPFDGRIARRHVDNFEDVSTMQPIFTLQDLSSLHIKVDIPETVMIKLRQDRASKIFASFDSLSDKQYPLALQAVSTEADPSSRTYTVTLSMPRVPDLNILPGMSVTVRGSQQEDIDSAVVMVPTQSVVETNEGRIVFVVEEQEQGLGIVRVRQVTTGKVSQNGIQVTSGLTLGDRVVTAGMSKMADGLTVRTSKEWSK